MWHFLLSALCGEAWTNQVRNAKERVPGCNRRENGHFLSLLAVGAVMMTVFFLFVGTSHHSSPYVEGGPELNPPTSRSRSLEVTHRFQPWRFWQVAIGS